MEDTIKLELIKDLPTGTTVNQKAAIYKSHEMVDYLASGELSYADIINLSLALNIASEFYNVCATVFVKNNTLTGVALGSTIFDSFQKAVDCNPIDAVCGAVAFTKVVDLEIARLLTSQHVVVAPEYSADAENYLDSKKIKYVKLNTPLSEYKNYIKDEIFVSPLGTLVQEKNKQELEKDSFKVVSKVKPTVEQIEDAIFAWKITKYLRSAGVVVAKDFKTSGISQGIQTPAFEYALDKSCEQAKDAVLASDVPLSIHDLNVAIQDRISLIIQPGVAPDVLKQADKFEIAMITTGISNFSVV